MCTCTEENFFTNEVMGRSKQYAANGFNRGSWKHDLLGREGIILSEKKETKRENKCSI
jgi:hypothetical protein